MPEDVASKQRLIQAFATDFSKLVRELCPLNEESAHAMHLIEASMLWACESLDKEPIKEVAADWQKDATLKE